MTAAEPRPRLAHLPALDGLRGLAVLAVMLYHGGAAVAPGGFLGVDLFFVLSGFLITSLLLLEFEARGRLDLRAFWVRRGRRLLPALLLVLAVVLVYAAFVAGQRAATIRWDAVASLFYVSNWWFIADGASYFDRFSDPSPLRHTWSLAIEEQWYLFLPLALVLVLPRLRSRRALVWAFGALAVVSAAWMFWLTPADGGDLSRAYYGTDTRLQALLVGAALAALLTPGAVERLRPLASWVGWLGLGLVLVAIVLVADDAVWMYRGGFLAVALAAAGILLCVVARPDGPVSRVLSWGPLTGVGRISYGLYLWHWPVYLLLTPARTETEGFPLLLLRFALTFLIAGASYRWIERPIRAHGLSRLTPTGRRIAVVAAPLALLAVAGLGALVARPAASDSLEHLQVLATATPSAPAADGTVRAVLVGDSVPLSLQAGYRPGMVAGLETVPAVRFGCGVIPFETSLNDQPMPFSQECRQWRDGDRKAAIAAAQADVGVLFAGTWEQYDRWEAGPLPYTDPRWHERTVADYAQVLRELQASTDRIVIVLGYCHGTPEVGLPDATMFAAGRYPKVVNDPKRIAAVNAAVQEAAQRAGVPADVVDPGELLCKKGFQPQIDGVQMQTDGLHFSEPGAALVWQWLGPRILAEQ